MVIPISHSELYGVRPTESQVSELISPFKPEPTFLSLAMWDLMFSLFEGDAEKYKYLQWFFINVLIREDQRERILRAAALGSESPRPLFGRWQLLGMRCKDYFRARKSVECLSLSGNPEQRSDEDRLPSRVTPG